jgi:hypothetical protein
MFTDLAGSERDDANGHAIGQMCMAASVVS